jgi:hypothetical protein
MGMAVVLIVYAIALSLAALVGAILLGGLAHVLTKKSGSFRRRAVVVSAFFPFACVLYAGGWFICYSTVNYVVFHRDPGLGDTWETPLPNGYALMMIDTTDQGTVYNPKTQPGGDLVVGRDDAVFGVRQLQVSNKLIFGARDSGYFGRMGRDSKIVDSYFELDTNRNAQLQFKSLDDLRKRAASEGVALQLREFASVFHDYRTTWFDYFAGLALLGVPLVGFFGLVRWVWNIKHSPAMPVSLGA